jgi:hypothetical protein
MIRIDVNFTGDRSTTVCLRVVDRSFKFVTGMVDLVMTDDVSDSHLNMSTMLLAIDFKFVLRYHTHGVK